MSTDLVHTWQRVRCELRNSVTDSIFHLWLEPLAARHIDEQKLVIEAPDEIRTWVTDRYSRLLSLCANKALGRSLEVELIGPQQMGARATPPVQNGATWERNSQSTPNKWSTSPIQTSKSTAPAPPSIKSEAINPRFTFDQFVIGDSNRLAHGAALAVAEMPGLAYNPLFICGAPGLGKTHLLHSIANYITSYGDGTTVRYVTVEAFTNHFLSALQGGGISEFKAAYRDVDVLLVDDIQFLQSKLKTEQEFFHTFNALYTSGAQIVLTSDRPPRDLDALEDRLRERFEAGLVTDIKSPNYGVRLTILNKRVKQDGLRDVSPDALELIADRVTTNVRALEGALIRVVAFSSLTNRPVTAELAEEVLSGLYPSTIRARKPSVREIQELTSNNFDISRDDLISTSRSPSVTWPRQLAMYLARELTEETLPTIGQAFGGRAHTTVMHAHRRITELLSKDQAAFGLVKELTNKLNGEGAPLQTGVPEKLCK
jgi:chromosomal replication initiator protein